MHAASHLLGSSYGAPFGANIGPINRTRYASGTMPTQNITKALIIEFMLLLSHFALTFEHSRIVHYLEYHPDVRDGGDGDPGRHNQSFQVRSPDECEAIMTCTPHVNSDGSHNARI